MERKGMSLYEKVKASLRKGNKPEHVAAVFGISETAVRRTLDLLVEREGLTVAKPLVT